MEFSLPSDGDVNGENPKQPAGSSKNRGRKAGVGRDELVEMRFYIPGTVVKKDEAEGDEKSGGEEEEEPEEQNAANLFYETLMDKAEIGDVAGDTFATFLDVLHLTPRFAPENGHPSRPQRILTSLLEGDLILICTKAHSDFGAKHTIIKSSISRLRNSFCYQRTTIPIL